MKICTAEREKTPPPLAKDSSKNHRASSLFQEFLAALYVFTMFRTESKNVLNSGVLHMPKFFSSKDHTKSAAGLIHCALERTFTSPLGVYDMFLRFLCGLLSPDCHDNQLGGFLYHHNAPKVGGLDEVQQLLEKRIQNAPQDRVEILKECLREMTQEDEWVGVSLHHENHCHFI